MKKNVILVSDNNQGIFQELEKEFRNKNIEDNYQVKIFNAFGLNSFSSIMHVYPENIKYVNFTKADIHEIVEEYFINGKIVKKFIYDVEDKKNIKIGKLPIYHKQLRLVMRNCGIIDPENINDYIKRDGYKSLAKVICKMTPEEVLEELKTSQLRGRGGAGYPTWLKWKLTKDEQDKIKYIVCNADEGDPGAYMNRSVLEGDPHSVIEGMAIAAYTVGAEDGYLYVRAEYPLAIKRLEKAIMDAKKCGLLGENILGTNFTFNIEIRLGAGAFVCGEETALLASIEGKRGIPRPRPPFPSVSGLWEKPTVINNVETFTNVPLIILKGGKWYSKIGTEKSKGTKVYALTGKVKNSGLIEVPMGTTLKELVYDAGGGILNNNEIKAIQTGGPSGGVIPKEYLDTEISYESLAKLGSIMGSGGMIVMDETDCMVDISMFYLQFSVDESCGKCSPCRIGGSKMLDILKLIQEGKANEETIPKLRSICSAMSKASLCGLGQNASNPVISTLRYFEEEYNEHIKNKHCKSGKCKSLLNYTIIKEICIGCHLCAIRCPANAITGDKKIPHLINQEKCIKCGICFEVCKFNAVSRI